jgi:PrsW family intramembrane metalloprotease
MANVEVSQATPLLAVEWWERASVAWHRRLATSSLIRYLRIATVVCWLCVLVAAIFVKGFREGMRVWLPCLLMLLAWTAILPTRTLRWFSITRMFAGAMIWALMIAWLSVRISDHGLVDASSIGPGVAIASIVEETFKALPLLVLAVLAPGRVRRFAVVDWLLCGLTWGMGFQASEDFLRQVVYKPGLMELMFGKPWNYGFTLFGGAFDAGGLAGFPGHHITTALIGAGIGFAVAVAKSGRSLARRLMFWSVPVVLWVVSICDHLAFNATNRDPS